jgi:hypothetical protein
LTAAGFDSSSRVKQAVANAYSACFVDARANIADAGHALHVAIGMAGPAGLERGVTDTKTPVLQSRQIGSEDHDIASQQRWIDNAATDTGGNHGEVLLLYQGDLTRAIGATGKLIAYECMCTVKLHLLSALSLPPRARVVCDPLNTTPLR